MRWDLRDCLAPALPLHAPWLALSPALLLAALPSHPPGGYCLDPAQPPLLHSLPQTEGPAKRPSWGSMGRGCPGQGRRTSTPGAAEKRGVGGVLTPVKISGEQEVKDGEKKSNEGHR